MSDIKKLFEKNRSSGIISNTTLKKVGDTVESADYVESNLKEKNRFVPYIDFTSASNFARYGSAEKYYTDSIEYISNEYPYDGSLKEKINWQLTASYFDLYMFEHEYPRTNGYILMGKNYGTPASLDSDYYPVPPNEQEYIFSKGSPHPSTGSGDIRSNWKEYNLYNTASLGKYNLEIDGNNGLTVEFWLNKDGFTDFAESPKQIVFDLWNSGTYGNADYGRFRVELTGGSGVLNSGFNIELRSGSTGFSYQSSEGEHSTTVSMTLPTSTAFTGSWNHFALSFQNTGSYMRGRLYRNGKLEQTLITGSSMGSVTGPMISTIGALVTSVSGTFGDTGAAKLSASLDDFRYWRRVRSCEKIAKYWFVPVGGGTNTDITNAATASTKYSYENPLDLGVYYKFNEGIINSSATVAQDSIILDYSGRTTNGAWRGYSVGSRFTGSAMVLSKAAKSEFKDPIIYTNNPAVVNLSTTKKALGLIHDQQNNASIYHSFPAWIIEEDEDRNRDVLKNLTQIMGSYFDTLQLQIESISKIKDLKYPSGSNKPYPFVNRLINNLGFVSSEVFENATALEFLASRDDERTYAIKLNETKNIIYQNIYNNLIYIFKSKGTAKSFRNLIRCYGIDEELVRLSLYGNNITYELRNNGDNRIIKKSYADFNDRSRFNATVWQTQENGNPNSAEYIRFDSGSNEVLFRGNTYEAEVIFPNKLDFDSVHYVQNDFVTASLYGCHTFVAPGFWATPDVGNFQVQSVRPSIHSTEAYFQLTGTAGGYFPLLTSSLFKDVYTDSKWNFAVKIKPSKYPLADGVTGSMSGSYDVEFSGYNYVLDILVNSFETSASMTSGSAWEFMTAPKAFFAGAHRQNWTSTVLQKADSKISSVRVWLDYLKKETIQAHAKDAENFGSQYPYKSAYISQLSKSLGSDFVQIPQIETLIMDWNFDTITSSNPSGQFTVPDVSSGSADLISRWGWLGPIAKWQYTGQGYDFPVLDTGSIDRRYVHSVKQQLPETLNSSDMVSIIDDTTRQIYSRDSRPIDYYFAFEKSMYGIVSEQMLNYFATIIAFNNLIGEPVNRYRQNYKDMEKLRALYFERVQNTPDFEKFVEYFKWIDASLGLMLLQLAPASSDFSQKLRNIVESHVLERNKYWTKFPSLKMNASDPEAGLRGINELLYSGNRGIAPMPTTATASNCEWWLDRANRNNPNISSGDSIIDDQRDIIRQANDFRSGSGPTLAVSRDSTVMTTTYKGQAYALRNFTKIYKLTVDESPEIHGGSNFPRAKTVEYTHEALKFGGSDTLQISTSSVSPEKGCTDVINPNAKERLEYKLQNSADPQGYISGKGTIFAPFSLFSSSVTTGYVADVARLFRTKTEIDNYHDDIYGDDKGIPAQGPFTERHVGGRQHRHININTASTDTTLTRPEAWNLDLILGYMNAKSFTWGASPVSGKAIELQDTSACSSPDGSWTVSMWFKNSYAGGNFMTRTGTTTVADDDWRIRVHGSGDIWMTIATVTAGSISIQTACAQVLDGDWHLLIFGYNADSNDIWIDIDDGSFTAVQSLGVDTVSGAAVGDCKLGIGDEWSAATSRWGTAPWFTGQFRGNIDEVSIWKTILGSSDITEIWNDGCPGSLQFYSPVKFLSSWYRMGDNPSDNATAVTGKITDIWGTNSGTPYNTAGDEIVSDVTSSGCEIVNGGLKLSSRTTIQPRATMIRDAYAKRPVNIANIKWGTGSQVAGNYEIDYQMLQTSGRKINNRFFVKNEGFSAVISDSTYISGVIDYALPRYDLTGTNKYIFVERFNAPGGPDVSSRGSMDINAEEYSVYNELNQRNSIVRNALQSWQTDHCGQFGIVGVSGAIEGYRQPRWQDYNTLASYHKVNRNAGRPYLWAKDFSREVEFSTLIHVIPSNYNTTFIGPPGASGLYGVASSRQPIGEVGYFEVELNIVTTTAATWLMGIRPVPTLSTTEDLSAVVGLTYPEYFWLWDSDGASDDFVQAYDFSDRTSLTAVGTPITGLAVGDKIRVLRNGTTITFQYKSISSNNWVNHYELTTTERANFYPSAVLPTAFGFTNPRISNPQYDNWYVQHAMPQSELQYAWINDSYDNKKDQPFGYASNYSVPSGTTSTTASAVQFSTASNWNFPNYGDASTLKTLLVPYAQLIPFDNVGRFSNIRPRHYKWQIEDRSPTFSLLDNLTATPDTKGVMLEKTSGGSAWNGGAAGEDPILDGGFIEFEPGQTDNWLMVGLNNDPPASPSYEDMNYAIELVPHSIPIRSIRIFEDGSVKDLEMDALGVPETLYEVGDRFRIAILGGKVNYQYSLKGNEFTTFYASANPVTGSLFLDCTLHGLNSKVRNLVVNAGANMVTPGYGFLSASEVSALNDLPTYINVNFNNLHGPYGYPSWQQTRTGETPVARYQRRNNILSVMSPITPTIIANGAGTGIPALNYGDPRADTFKNFIEPPVDFKYRPLDIEQVSHGESINVELGNIEASSVTVKIRSTYANNTCLFSQGPVNDADGTFTNNSISNFLNMSAYKSDKQIYDRILETPSLYADLNTTLYREIIYPRGANTGLAQTRGRTKYAEVANTIERDFSLPGTASTFAVTSSGPNGIDRGPIERRTFWKDSETLRNRTEGYSSSSLDWVYFYRDYPNTSGFTDLRQYDGSRTGPPPVTASWSITGTLPNSQGHYDGCATSIYGLGRTPIVWDFSWFLRKTQQYILTYGVASTYTYFDSPGWFYSGSLLINNDRGWNFTGSDYGPGLALTRSFTSPLDYPDRGELNSANYQTIAGYAGTAISSSNPDFAPGYYCTMFPTASAYYYHLPFFNTTYLDGVDWWSDLSLDCTGNDPSNPLDPMQICDSFAQGLGVNGMRWRTEELSGKRPWFNSYAEYAEDIRGVGKNLTIVPAFNVSEHMPYYLEDGDMSFYKNNDKFLSLPGGEMSSSAVTHRRGFTEKFFNDYSNSDFQKYFGKFNDVSPNAEDEIILKCNVVKKLLPYQGFYPHQRTLQLASLFSQSLGPYISGLSWSAGQPENGYAWNEPSGALAMQATLQPFFAPGILYNTIKSGIACDWAAYTGSQMAPVQTLTSGSFINQESNYRIPFEALLDPLGDVGFPQEKFNSSTEEQSDQNLHLLYPTYQSGSYMGLNPSISLNGGVGFENVPIWNSSSAMDEGRSVYGYSASRKPFVKISNEDRTAAITNTDYNLYQLAMNNFLAEVPNFFLAQDEFGNSLTSFVSKKQEEISVEEGKFYYMDISLTKGKDLVMWEDYFNYSSDSLTPSPAGEPEYSILGKGIDGHSFGPPVQSGEVDYMMQGTYLPNAPSFAPYTPPYYYGSSTARLTFSASSNTFTWNDFFANTTVEYFNPIADAAFQVLSGTTFTGGTSAPASASMMTLSSSLNIFGLAVVKDVKYGPEGQVLEVADNRGGDKNRWVVSTKMETPVLDFSSSTPREFGYSRGMWGGYGQSGGTAGAKKILLELKESFTSDGQAPENYDKDENNFLKRAFFNTGIGHRKRIGQTNDRGKEIAEAIVAIPYVLERPMGENMALVTEKQIMGKYFFTLRAFPDTIPGMWDSCKIYTEIRKSMRNSGVAVDQRFADKLPALFDGRFKKYGIMKGDPKPIESTSISRMLEAMDKYVIPPELDFTINSPRYRRTQRGTDTSTPFCHIEPFAMYIFEFTHQLSKQDLVDIWQGLMPEISTTAELDSTTLSHPKVPFVEFFSGRSLPPNVRWMVFKVKKKANNNYYKLTADTKDDQNFAGNPFTVGEGVIPYSYNWPYDYFSLIELAELEAGNKFKK